MLTLGITVRSVTAIYSPHDVSGAELHRGGTAFLQQRVALFWKVIFLIALIPVSIRFVLDPGATVMRTGVVLDLVCAGLFGLLWMLSRTGRRSAGVLLAIEWVGLATVSLVFGQGGMDDFPKVLDFGLVKDIQHGGHVALTQADVVAGTPLFLAPEAITAPERVSARSDLYSLGAVGYFAVTGTNVFDGKTLVEVCSHHLHTKPEPPSVRLGRPVPKELESLILDCLEKDPARRPAGVEEMRDRLEACGDLGGWTVGDARTWWEQNAAALAKPPEAVEDSELTLTRHRNG